MNGEPSLFVNWLRSHHRLGRFDRKDQWGQVSLSRFDDMVHYKLHILELEQEKERREARYEEQAFLNSVFSSNPAAKDIFLKMFPRYAEVGEMPEEEAGLDFFIPQSDEEIQDLLADAQKMGLFPDTK